MGVQERARNRERVNKDETIKQLQATILAYSERVNMYELKVGRLRRNISKLINDEPFICGSCREHCSEYTYSEDRDVDECNNCKTSNHER